MKYIFVINKFTIGDKYETLFNKISNYCTENKLEFVIEDNGEKNTEDILIKYKNSKNIIIAVGGDGMINRVLNFVVNTDNILGFIPSGTGNDFYRSVKLQCNNGINKCDIIRINNKYFINTACFGIDADIANDSTIIGSKVLKKYKYIINLIKHFYKYKARNFVVEVDNKIIKNKFITIVLCNGMYYGRGFNIGPKTVLNDGLIDVYLVIDVNKLKMLSLILKMKNGKHDGNKNVDKYVVDRLYIKSKKKLKCNIDGEVLEDKNFDIKVLNKKLNLYYDQNMIDNILK